MTGFLMVVALVTAAVAAYRWLPRGRTGVVSQVDAFQQAREVTNRWSADPSTTPQPLRDYLRSQQQPPAAEG
jgi:hypothetical protein